MLVTDGVDFYRAVVVKRRPRVNPEYVQGSLEHPYYLYDGEEYENAYGPYDKIGTAKSILTREMLNRRTKEPAPGVVSGRVEKANITWEKVDL